MAQDGKLRLKILDAQGRPVQGSAEVRLYHQVLSDRRVVTVDASKINVLTGLYATPQGLYRVEVSVPSYELINQFVTIAASGFTDLEVVLRKAGAQVTPPRPPSPPPPTTTPPPPTPPPPAAPPAMTAKERLLALDRYSNLSLKELRTQNRTLYDQLQGVIADARKGAALSYFANGSDELREQLQKLDYALGDRPERGLKQLILDGLAARQLKPELLKEAGDRLSQLESGGMLADPALADLPIRNHPLFQQDLQHAAIYKLADVDKLADAKAEKIIDRLGSAAAITDQALDALVKDGTLTETEAKSLGLTTTLYHLTDASFALIVVLKQTTFPALGGKLSRPRDLAALGTTDWLAALERAQVNPPDGQDRKSYAEELSRMVAALFPTDTFLGRVPKETQPVTPALELLKPLLDNNRLAFGRGFDGRLLEGLSAAQRAAHDQLRRLVNLNPGLRLEEILNGTAASAEKAKAVAARLGVIDRFTRLNPGADFLTLDYTPGSDDMARLKFDGLSHDDQRLAVSNFKIIQRVFDVTKDSGKAQDVLAAGYRSAADIAGNTFDSFKRRTGFSDAEAAGYYVDARNTLATVSVVTAVIIDLVKGIFTLLPVGNVAPDVYDYLKGLDGFADLFGSQDYCLCTHCQSILSPAAYFVDLMRFVEQYVLENPEYDFTGARSGHPLNLKVRRPDLWTLPLTCENTNNLVPYLDIINEILENYVYWRRGFTGDTSDRAAVESAIYKQTLSGETAAGPILSFRQPFFLPLERLEAYLSHFGQSRAAIARTLSTNRGVTTAAALKISDREYKLIAEEKLDLSFLKNLYGIDFAPSGGTLNPFDAKLLLKYTALTREDLGLLLRTRFVMGGDVPPVEIRAEKSSSDSVQNDVERVHNLTLNALDRLHRFARLWRRVAWSILELDLVLTQLSAAAHAEISYPVAENVADILALEERWGLPVEQNCALWSTVPRLPAAPGRESLFDRLFNFRPFVMTDGPLPKDAVRFVHPAFSAVGAAPTPDNTLHRLLAGLQLSSDQLVQLVERLAGPLGAVKVDGYGFLLTAHNLTLLYRHARLAQLLDLSIPDLFQLVGFADIGGHVADLDGLIPFLRFYDWWKTSRFTLDDIGFITRGFVQKPADYPDPGGLAAQIIEELKADNSFEFADTVFAFIPDVTEKQSRDIIAANGDAFRSGGLTYTLADGFNAFTSLAVPAGVPAGTAAAAKNLALKYHVSALVPRRLATHLGMSSEKIGSLIAMTGVGFNFHNSSLAAAVRTGDPGPLAALLDKLLRPAALFRAAVFDPPALGYVSVRKEVFDLSDFDSIGVEAVRKVSLYATIATTGARPAAAGEQAPDPADIRQALDAFGAAHDISDADKSAIARVCGTGDALVSTLLPNLSLPGNPIEALSLLSRAVKLAAGLGVSGEVLNLVLALSYDELARAGEAVLSAFRAGYADEQAFLNALEPLEDKLRSRKRDALTDFILRSYQEEFATLDGLYAYLLVDVQLEGCARTSRVVSAVSSLQLYVYRCLMNLEQSRRDPADPKYLHVLPESIPADEWEWRKNYRVWEANRKVFLYPENYIEPELRDDKTPLFKDLESELLQKRIDEQHVLDAYASYLSGFEEVSRLKIAGSYHHIGAETDVLHLFGVTPGDPPIYYYRTIENAHYSEAAPEKKLGIVYSPWRKISVQIPVREVSPIVYLGRLFVFWLQITTAPKNVVAGGGSQFVGYKHKMTLKYTTLRLNGTWTPPQSVSLVGGYFNQGDGVVTEPLYPPGYTVHAGAAYPAGKSPDKGTGFISGVADIIGVAVAGVSDVVSNIPGVPLYDASLSIHSEPQDGYTVRWPLWSRVYPAVAADGSLRVTLRDFTEKAKIDFYRGQISHLPDEPARVLLPPHPMLTSRLKGLTQQLYHGIRLMANFDLYAEDVLVSQRALVSEFERTSEAGSFTDFILAVNLNSEHIADLHWLDEIHIVNGGTAEAVIDCNGDLLLLQGSVRPAPNHLLKRLGTTLGETLARTLFTGGVNALLDTETQSKLGEAALPIKLIDHVEDAVNAGRLDFKGPFGTYYREIFFHVPFIIANQLNGQQRFAAAQKWYHYIFNPTATDLPQTLLGSAFLNLLLGGTGVETDEEKAQKRRDRVWRYLEFRGLGVPSLREALTDAQAIEAYKKDPFNPHAIARLRLSAYQKCIVMKYIDNLLDWGDSLFTQFTTESVNEATLLYVIASDILGPRPARLGDCGEGKVSPQNYETIGPLVRNGSDFLAEVESLSRRATGYGRRASAPAGGYTVALSFLSQVRAGFKRSPNTTPGTSGGGNSTLTTFSINDGRADATSSFAADAGTPNFYAWKETITNSWTREKGTERMSFVNDSPLIKDFGRAVNFGWSLVRQLSPVFCIPENKDLNDYWDRVEDRLYKIRHCMDITGARRQLALFAPEIDPRLLVRAKAAGLSIEDVLNATSGDIPPYRFAYLIEKAKQYAGAVQGFGAALLGALEKRDAEELNRLRTVHQQNLLSLTTRLREREIDIASDAVTTLERQQQAILYRKNYYQALIDSGYNNWETTQQVSRHIVSTIRVGKATLGILSGTLHLIPQLGSPFAMKYGGQEMGQSTKSFGNAVEASAEIAEAISASAGLEAGFQRREEGWKHQVELADKELSQLERQLTSANLRKEIAVRSLDLHNKSMEQLEEVFEFFNERFTSLGLYTWLSTSLQRVYREAYNSAYSMARLAEQAFRFERDADADAPLLQGDYWDSSNAGLHAGERLLVALQNLERRFIETNYRTLEIDQSFSLTQINPAALIDLRENGSCAFDIPEIFFDLFYPGQYRRKIKSVRLTIPCVTGPYTNVSATLTLNSSRLRNKPQMGDAHLQDVPLRHSASIAASTAQADSGVFEFSFRDERYMPFEGAGAVSTWGLALPKHFRQLDYQTINDVIIHVSYTAEEDGKFRTEVEGETAKAESAIRSYLKTKPLARALSLRQDFSGALNRLQHSPSGTEVKIQITDKYLPIFLRGQKVTLVSAKLALKTSVDAGGFGLRVNAQDLSIFSSDTQLGALSTADATTAFAQGIIGEHTLAIKSAGGLAPDTPQPGDPSALDSAKLLDLILYFEYKLQ